MSLTSQLITDVFPDLEKVRKLNIEAFPEEERVPLDEFLLYQDRDDAHFFAFYPFIMRRSLLALPLPSPIKKLSISAFSPSCLICVAMVMEKKLLKS